MAKYRVQGPDGAVHVFEGPDDASQDQVLAFAQQHFSQPAAASAPAAPAAPVDEGKAFRDKMVARETNDLSAQLRTSARDIIDGGAELLARGYDKIAPPQLGLSDLVAGRSRAPGEAERVRALNQPRREAADKANEGEILPKIQRVLGQALLTSPVGPVLGAGAKALGATRLGAAIGSGGMSTGAEVVPGVVAKAVDMATRVAGGAINGGATAALVDPDSAGTGAKIGAALPPGVTLAGKVGKVIGAAGRTVKAVAEPLYQAGREAIAGRTLRSAAGASADDVAARLAGAAELVPGSAPTAAQVAESGGVAALERTMAAAHPEEFAKRGMDQAAARTQALRGIAGDEAARAAAVEARKVATDPLYAQAKQANYTVDGRLERLLQTPAIKQAMERAKTLAANNQRPFAFDVEARTGLGSLGNQTAQTSRQITGQGLQDLKMAIDEMLTDPASGFAGSSGDAVKALRGQLLNWMEGANPAFKQARTTFSQMSKPVNQMDVGQELLNRLEPALADHGALGRETGNKYALALRNADQTARKATKFKGAGMDDVMEPQQMQTLSAIAQDLARKANGQDLGRGVGSDTFQKLALSNIAERSGMPRAVGGALNMPGVSKVAKFMYSAPEEQIQSVIAKALLEPQMAADLMRRVAGQGGAGAGQNLLFASPQAQQLLYRGAPVTADR